MIYFKKLRWRNFLSTGNQFIEVDLRKAPSTLIIGMNGAGKSTLLDALCFALFNRAFRDIKKEQLVNTINQNDCEIEVEFETSNKQYKVIRGIKPNKFEVYCNDEDQDFDIEIALPDYEFDDLIKIMMEKHDICYDDPEKVVFFTEFNSLKYKLIRSNDGTKLM